LNNDTYKNTPAERAGLFLIGILQVPVKYTYYTLKSARINQWYKNVLIFAGLAFSSNLTNWRLGLTSLLAFFYFCVLSGAGYIINDIADRDKDASHLFKKDRPIASRRFPIKYALPIALILIAAALFGSWMINRLFFTAALSYLAVTLSYSFYFKKVVLVDIIAVSIGFVIRAIAGCVAIGVNISPWLIICSFLLALFLVLNKRWHSLNVLNEQTSYTKSILEFYSTSTLDKLINIVTSSLLVAYLVYAINTNKVIMLVSTVFVVYGLFRYLYLVQHMNYQADPDKALRDKGLLISMGCWVICILMLSKI